MLALVLPAACGGGTPPAGTLPSQGWPELAPVASFAAPPPPGDPDAESAALTERARALRLRAAALSAARP
jgi:hypothetical protein